MAWKPDYVTVTELANFVKADEAVEDFELGLAVTAASRAVDDATNRQFGKVAAPQERFYTGKVNYRRGRWYASIDDLTDTTGLVVSINGTAVTSYTFEPVNALAEGKAYERIVFGTDAEASPDGFEPDISITASWGWSAVPDTIKEATLLQGSRFFARRESPYGVAGSPSIGSEVRLLARADPDVAVMVHDYIRDRVTVG
jgi:hypothetical protein